jgi:hypothetical protein
LQNKCGENGISCKLSKYGSSPLYKKKQEVWEESQILSKEQSLVQAKTLTVGLIPGIVKSKKH